MQRLKWIALGVCLLVCSSLGWAQASKPAEPKTEAQVMDRMIAGVEGEFVPAAEAMPDV